MEPGFTTFAVAVKVRTSPVLLTSILVTCRAPATALRNRVTAFSFGVRNRPLASRSGVVVIGEEGAPDGDCPQADIVRAVRRTRVRGAGLRRRSSIRANNLSWRVDDLFFGCSIAVKIYAVINIRAIFVEVLWAPAELPGRIY